MPVGKLSKRGQIVIPKEIRDRMGIKPGDGIIFKIQDGKIILEKIQEKVKDILKAGGHIEPSLEFQKKLRDEWG